MQELTCFKAYDVRGRLPDQLNEEIVYRIGRAYAIFIGANEVAKRVVVGYDIRLSSKQLSSALIRGLLDSGVDVQDIGQCGTEEIYFATSHLGMDGGIVVTASHNPKDYNGLKFVRENSKPISADTGLKSIRALAESNLFPKSIKQGQLVQISIRDAYINHLLTYTDVTSCKPIKVACNAGNGGAGAIIDLLEPHLPYHFEKLYHEADGNFPNGVPNPLLEENREPTRARLLETNADVAIAWDGDFDRCFFWDEKGQFIEGYYIVGLLAQHFLQLEQAARIVHDPRLIWNTQDIVLRHKGIAVQSKSGHAFMKDVMRNQDAIYGGEMSAHHYFRRFFYCDSGMIPWLVVLEILSRTDKTMSQLVEECVARFPSSGEINCSVKDAQIVMAHALAAYEAEALNVDLMDGVSVDFKDWRFNLRSSNTEPLIRLNVESRGSVQLMQEKTRELLNLISSA
jgi:phosphomannomutase